MPPSDKVNVAVVGVGGRGRRNINELLKLPDVQVMAIADPAAYWDLRGFYYQSEAGRGPVKQLLEAHYREKTPNYRVKEQEDFRVLLEEEPGIDAILCATPDHTHAYISLWALRAGKHVYCEKPLTHNVWEAREVQRVARETGLATQMGNQLHSTIGVRQLVAALQTDLIGPVREVHAWVPASRWLPGLQGLPSGSSPLPQGLNWDLWLGPRPMRPFHEQLAPVTWRDFWAYGCGALGDFGCHDMDAAVWGLKLPPPVSVEAYPAGYSDADIAPYGEIAYYEFPLRGRLPACRLNWYSGGLRPPRPALVPDGVDMSGRGSMFVGEKGILLGGGSRPPKVFPQSLAADMPLPEAVLPPTNGHHRDWVDAIKGGPPASSNFEYAARLTEITLLGVMALRLGGTKIYWDAAGMQARGLPEAELLVKEPVRAGWEM